MKLLLAVSAIFALNQIAFAHDCACGIEFILGHGAEPSCCGQQERPRPEPCDGECPCAHLDPVVNDATSAAADLPVPIAEPADEPPAPIAEVSFTPIAPRTTGPPFPTLPLSIPLRR